MDLKSLDAILVPLDFSDTSFGALETALSIAPRERVHLAHVLPVAGGLAWAVGAGLIIIGSHGRGGLEKLILGSVAYDVVRNSRRPVLLERATR